MRPVATVLLVIVALDTGGVARHVIAGLVASRQPERLRRSLPTSASDRARRALQRLRELVPLARACQATTARPDLGDFVAQLTLEAGDGHAARGAASVMTIHRTRALSSTTAGSPDSKKGSSPTALRARGRRTRGTAPGPRRGGRLVGHRAGARGLPDRPGGGRTVIAISRATLIPILVACILVGLTYGLGLGLDWSNGAMGIGAVITCVTVAVTRTTLAHNNALRDRAEPDHRA